jgi:hypothetical protein
LIPWNPEITDFDNLSNICQFITPNVVIFGSYLTKSQLTRLFNKGFQEISMFLYNDTEDYYHDHTEYVNPHNSDQDEQNDDEQSIQNDDEQDEQNASTSYSRPFTSALEQLVESKGDHSDNITDTASSIDLLSSQQDDTRSVEKSARVLDDIIRPYFDKRFKTFDYNTIYKHMYLGPYGLQYHIAEHVILGSFPNYQPINTSITYINGKYLIKYLRLFSFKPLGIILEQSIPKFEDIDNLIIKGNAIYEDRERTANHRIDNGYSYTIINPLDLDSPHKCYAIYGTDLMEEMQNLAFVNPSIVRSQADYIIFYQLCNIDCEVEDSKVVDQQAPKKLIYKVLVLSNKKSARLFLSSLQLNANGSLSKAISWLEVEKRNVLLSFL